MNMNKGLGIYSSCGSNLNSIPEINSNIGSERDLELGDGMKVRSGETWRERRDRILRLEKKEVEVAKRSRLRREEEDAQRRDKITEEFDARLRERVIEEGVWKEKRQQGEGEGEGEGINPLKLDEEQKIIESIINTEAKVEGDASVVNLVEGDGKKSKRKVYFNKKIINSLKEILWTDKKDNSSSNNDIDRHSSNCTDYKSNIDIIISNSNDCSNSTPNGSNHNDVTNSNSRKTIPNNISTDVKNEINKKRSYDDDNQMKSDSIRHTVFNEDNLKNSNIIPIKNSSNHSDNSAKSFFSRSIWPIDNKSVFSFDTMSNKIVNNQNSVATTNSKFNFFSHFFGTLPMLRRNRELNYFIVEITDSSGLGADEV